MAALEDVNDVEEEMKGGQFSTSGQLLEELARALASRNRALSERLQPGLSEADVKRILAEAGVQGKIEALVVLYTWRNGALWGEPAFFPQSAYQFLSLQEAIEDYEGNKSAATELVETLGMPRESVGDVRRYFPVFADGGGGYLEVDLDWEGRNAVAEFDFEGGPPREVYPSFDEFLLDTIRSNQEDDALRFFDEEED